MGKKNKNRAQMQKRGGVKPMSKESISQIFGGEGTEPITEDLIAELVGKGWAEDDLRKGLSMGAMYSRPRNSLLMPPRTMWDD
jgi:hypothetical protein